MEETLGSSNQKEAMHTITILAYNRPEYLKQCIAALRKCRGIENYSVVLCNDGGAGARPYGGTCDDMTVIQCEDNHGIDWHNAWCFDAMFQGGSTDFNVAVEDDCILSPDALELATWFYEDLQRDKYLFCSLGKNSKDPLDATVPEKLDEYPGLASPHAWCFTRSAWDQMRPSWNSKTETPTGWDWSLAMEMYLHGWKALAPQLARALNIGRQGVHSHPEWFDANMVGQVVSDGSYQGSFIIDTKLPYDWSVNKPAWMSAEIIKRGLDA
jgi:hypothetical protein